MDHARCLEEDEEGEHDDCGQGDDPAHHRLADGQSGTSQPTDKGLEPGSMLFHVSRQVEPCDQPAYLSLAFLSLANQVGSSLANLVADE